MIQVHRGDFELLEVPDSDPDPSYLEQTGFEERLAQWKRGDFGFVGVKASIDLPIPYGSDCIHTRIESPGLWGIESDSGREYLRELFEEECSILIDMLRLLDVQVLE